MEEEEERAKLIQQAQRNGVWEQFVHERNCDEKLPVDDDLIGWWGLVFPLPYSPALTAIDNIDRA